MNIKTAFFCLFTGTFFLRHDAVASLEHQTSTPFFELHHLSSKAQAFHKNQKEFIFMNCDLWQLPEMISNPEEVESIKLINCYHQDDSTDKTTIQDFLKALKKIKRLTMEGCDIDPDHDVFHHLHLLSTLETLDITEMGLEDVPQDILSLTHLKHLSLSSTDIQALPHTIGNLQALVTLDMSETAIDSLPASLFKLGNLASLDISSTAVSVLPHEIGQLTQLTYLSLEETDIKKLPPSIKNLVNLREIHLSGLPRSLDEDAVNAFIKYGGRHLMAMVTTQIRLFSMPLNLSLLDPFGLNKDICNNHEGLIFMDYEKFLEKSGHDVEYLPESYAAMAEKFVTCFKEKVRTASTLKRMGLQRGPEPKRFKRP